MEKISSNFIFLKNKNDYTNYVDSSFLVSLIDTEYTEYSELLNVLSSTLQYDPWSFENWDRMIDYLSCNYDKKAIHRRLAIVHLVLPNFANKKDLTNYILVLNDSLERLRIYTEEDYVFKVMFTEKDRNKVYNLIREN